MQRSALSLILLSLFACKPTPPEHRYHYRENYCLVDSASAGPLTPFEYDGEAHYPIYYVGPVQEHVPIHQRLAGKGPRPRPTHPIKWEPDSCSLSIFVDTFSTQFEQHHYQRDTAYYFSYLDSISRHPAFSVVLRNLSDSTLVLGNSDLLQYVVLEVKRSNDEWFSLEKTVKHSYDQGSWASFVYLNPGDVLVAKFPRYAPGEVRQCRLAWRLINGMKIYSNPFHAPVSDMMLHFIDLMEDNCEP